VAKKFKKRVRPVVDPNASALRVWGGAQVMGCSDRAFERLLKTGQLKSFRIGRMRFVRRKTLEEFLAAREQAAL
jgi:excisionase family DNA binding protein